MTDILGSVLANVGQVQVLHGLGGCGKTAVAWEVARRAKDESGVRVWWISATDPATLNNSFRELAEDLAINPEAIEAAWSGRRGAPELLWRTLLRMSEPWLIVVDEADDPEILAAPGSSLSDGVGWLRFEDVGAVLVTSRHGNVDVWGDVALLELPPLDTSDAADVLMDAIGVGTAVDTAGTAWRGGAAAVVKSLNAHPLCLRLAGAYLHVRFRDVDRWSDSSSTEAHSPIDRTAAKLRIFANFAAALADDIAVLDSESTARLVRDVRPQRRRLEAVWKPCCVMLEERGLQDARFLLEVLSCYEAAPLPVVVLNTGVLSRCPPFARDCDSRRRNELLDELASFSLVEALPSEVHGNNAVRVQRLIAESVRAALATQPPNLEYAWWTALRLLERAAPSEDDPTAGPFWDSLAPHCLRLAERCPRTREAAVDMGILVHRVFRHLRRKGADQACDRLTVAALQAAECTLGTDHPTTLTIRHDRARMLALMGSKADAAGAFEAVLLDRRRVLGPTHRATLETRIRLVALLRDQDNPAVAVAEFEGISQICANTLGRDDRLTLDAMNSYAVSLSQSGRWQEALAVHRDVLARRESVFGREHSETVSSYNNLAFTLQRAGLYAEALPIFRDTFERRRARLGDDHANTSRSQANMASLLLDMGRLDEAEATFRELHARRSAARGDDHPDTLIVRYQLARILHYRGLHTEAAVAAAAVAERRAELFGPDDRKTLEAMALHGRALAQSGDPEGETITRGVLATRQRVLDPGHPDLLASAYDLAVIRCAQGSPDEAVALLAETHSTRIANAGPGHPETLRCAAALARARFLAGLGDRWTYRDELVGSITDFEYSLGADHPETCALRTELASLHQ